MGMVEPGSELRSVLDRHRAFWECDPVDSPLRWTTPWVGWSEWGPYFWADGGGIEDGARIEPGQLDIGRALSSAIVQLQPAPKLKGSMTALMEEGAWDGEAPILDGDFVAGLEPYPFPWMEAVLGCPIYHEKGSFWAARVEEDWTRIPRTGDWRLSPWLEELERVREWMVSTADGRMGVGSPLLRGPFDMAAGAIGAAEFCLAVIDQPEELEGFLAYCTELYLDVARRWFAGVPTFHGGYCLEGYWGLLAPGTAVRFQSDNSYLISPRQYRQSFLRFDRQVAQAYQYPAMATHTTQQNHLATYCEIPELRMIEVTLELPPFGRPPLSLLSQLRAVQEAGKALLVHGTATRDEMNGLVEGLLPTGLAVRLRIRDDES